MRWVYFALLVVSGALLASFWVLPQDQVAYLAVSRWGNTTTLLPPGLRFAPWVWVSRWALAKKQGRVVLPLTITTTSSTGATLKLEGEIELTGSGPLNVPAAQIRQQGLAQAVGEALQKALPPDLRQQLWQATDQWTQTFPEADAHRQRVLQSAASLFSPLEVQQVHLQASDSNLLRIEAKTQLTNLTLPRGRLVVVGLDALDWDLVDELTAKGLMPNLAKLLGEACSGEVAVPAPLISPVVWTTIATGQPPEVHGVLDFLEPDPQGGPPHPVSAASRKVPALWEMLAAAGQSVAVIGWWATFPAQAPPGSVVYSDRLTEQLLGLQAVTPALADPPKAQEQALQQAVKPQELTLEQLRAFAPVTQQEFANLGKSGWDDPVGGLAKLLAATLTVERLTEKELAAPRQALFIYLEGTDTVGHLFAPYRPPALPGVKPEDARRFGSVVDRYMTHVDNWLGKILAQLQPQDSLVIVSDHGFAWGADRPRLPSGAHTATAVWWHKPVGFLAVRSPQVTPQPRRLHLNLLQVAPLLLALAGLPQASDLPQASPAWVRDVPAGKVNYSALLGPPAVPRVELPPEARAEELAKLRALGYLGGGDTSSPAAESQPPHPKKAFDRAEARRLNNAASSLAANNQKAKAEELYRQAIAADPTYAAPHYNLSLLLRAQGRYHEADQEFWQAVDAGLAEPELTITRGALDYREKGELSRAEAFFRQGLARFPRSSLLLLNAGVFYGELGKLAEARDLLQRAVELDPTNAKAHRNLAVAFAGLGEEKKAIQHLEQALRLDPGDTAARKELARLRGQGVQ